MMSAMEVPDCPELVEIISLLQPVFTVYTPHDLSQPLLTNESQRLGLRANATTQEIAGYGNSPYRFNIWFEKP